MLIKIKRDNMDHGPKQRRYTKSFRNTNKLTRVKTGPGVIEKIGETIGGAFKPKKNNPTTTTPSATEYSQSQILNTQTPAERLASQFGGLNQDAMQAMVAGGSKPMHQGTSSQIDPMTGMPIVPGGQMNINPAFGGAMANSGIPNYNPGMNMANITQARKEMSREEKKAQIMSRDLPEDVKQNMIEGINQEANDAKKDGTLVEKLGAAAAQAAPKAINMRIVENVIVPDTSYKIGNKGPRKSMVVKRNK
tara:strand:+ start:772 stop:1518 length:747 start_codon:yes stop_codon:yes gene_type:complete